MTSTVIAAYCDAHCNFPVTLAEWSKFLWTNNRLVRPVSGHSEMLSSAGEEVCNSGEALLSPLPFQGWPWCISVISGPGKPSCTTDLSSSLEIVIAWFYQIQGTQPQHHGGTWARYIVTPILFRKLGFQAILLFTTHQIEPQWQSRYRSRSLPSPTLSSNHSDPFPSFPIHQNGGHCLLWSTLPDYIPLLSSTHSVSRSGLKLEAGWLEPELKSPPHVHFR